jgi:hypothetical protein
VLQLGIICPSPRAVVELLPYTHSCQVATVAELMFDGTYV